MPEAKEELDVVAVKIHPDFSDSKIYCVCVPQEGKCIYCVVFARDYDSTRFCIKKTANLPWVGRERLRNAKTFMMISKHFFDELEKFNGCKEIEVKSDSGVFVASKNYREVFGQ